MLAPCEIAVKSVIPAIRSQIAKELTQTYKMKQDDVASLLGITQTAVSKYISNVRGQAIRIDQSEQIRSMMSDIASKIADGQISGPVLMVRFCEVCRVVRQDGLMCDLCRRSDPTLDARKCYICKPEKPAGVR